MSKLAEPQQRAPKLLGYRCGSPTVGDVVWISRVRGLRPHSTCVPELALRGLIGDLDQFECWGETWSQAQRAELSVLPETGKGTD